MLNPLENERHKQELGMFLETDNAKTFSIPFEKLLQNISQKLGESVDLERAAYLSRGIELLVRFYTLANIFSTIN